ncbi:ribulokinase [Sphingobacterium spiritivorum]|uniref:ribulokinase n=1 Tax=Sphingobacterium spiritivorum TaxID=258 RepID=UPI003DA69F13
MKPKQYVIGVDFGSDSVRSIIVDALTGTEVSSAIHFYSRWQEGLYCDASRNQFRQHPLDYIEGLVSTIKSCIIKAGGQNIAASVKGIAVDTTGSTPVAVDRSGTPLALCEGFEDNPNAMFVLWKDHTSVREAAEINTHAQKFDMDYLKYVGSIYSSEWFWAKLLHILRVDEKVRSACHSWVEHCDWIPFLLTGGTDITKMKRSRCAAGHKALWAEEFDGLPPDTFFSSLDPLLAGFSSRLFTETYTSDIPAGHLCPEWAERLGLSTSVVVSVGAFDAHMGAVGGQIEPYHLSKVMGTSTCDILVVPGDDIKNTLIKGICGQVNGSVIPGMVGLEAGQSAFGDLYAWFKQVLAWPLKHLLSKSAVIDAASAKALEAEMLDLIIPELSRQASGLPLSGDDELAIDWLNGRRTPDASQELKGALSQLDLGTDAPRIFKALVEASCFGARNIIERFITEGIPVKGIIGLGGVAKKSPYIMQMMADVLQMPIRIHRSEHTCALGAAMFAAVAAGIYDCIEDAMQAMGSGFDCVYHPDTKRSSYFDNRFLQYKSLGHYIEYNSSHE